jgi:arylsulfatase A-like enzyme
VDEQIGDTLDLLSELGVERDTVVIFTSDNGVTFGEHRLHNMFKGCPYEECQRVPFIVRYPRAVEPGSTVTDTAALNIDVAPTIASLAEIEVPTPVDGVSLAPWLLALDGRSPRTEYLMESWRQDRNDSIRIEGLVQDGDQLRLMYGNSRKRPRASTLFEFDSDGSVDEGAVPVRIDSSRAVVAKRLASAVRKNVDRVSGMWRGRDVDVRDRTRARHGVYWWVEVDPGGALALVPRMPDYFGIRDIAGEAVWIEYETGERELYDLRADPHQLENVANDPDYSAIRTGLEQRLEVLLDQARAVGKQLRAR